MFKTFKKEVKHEIDLKRKCLRSNHGKEFTSKEFEKLCEEQGIIRQYSTPRTPQHNGVVERKNKIVVEMAKTMLCD